jgi:hypothetical protein
MTSIRDRLHDRATPTGVGLGLRGAFAQRIVDGDADGKLAFLEISPENYMHRGGPWRRRLEAVAERFAIITHGVGMSLGSLDPFDEAYFDQLVPFVTRHGTGWHSDHLCFSDFAGAQLHDLLPLPMTTSSAIRVAERIQRAQDRIGKPMVIENISYYVPVGRAGADEAEFITEVCERADCGLLLDVNNIYVNSKNFGFDAHAMLARYPLERVVQLHVAGHTFWKRFEFWLDDHGAEAEPIVHEMMMWVVERIGPVPVLLERDTAIPSLEVLLAEVAALQADYDQALARHHATATNQPLREVARV